MNIVQSIIIGIVEGITEFIPISSTGHMIIAEKLLGIKEDEFTKMFTVAIQLGAILAVVVLYWKKFFDFKNLHFYFKLIIGVLPAIILGLLFADKIDEMMGSTLVVAFAILLGGIVLIFIDQFFKHPTIRSEKQVTYAKFIYNRYLAMPGDDSRNEPKRGFHYRWNAAKAYPERRC